MAKKHDNFSTDNVAGRILMKRIKRVLSFTLVLALMFSISLEGNSLVANAKKKIQLNKKKVTLVVGNKTKLKLKNNKKKVKWSSSKRTVAIVSSKGVVTAKKKGTATITAKAGKKKYTCKVTVKAKKRQAPVTTQAPTEIPRATKTPTATVSPDIPDSYKNESDVSILQGIIREQKQKGAAVSEDLDDIEQYTWREGRLVGVKWQGSSVCDKLDVSGLTALEYLNCGGNQLSSLDVSKNTALKYLYCGDNQLNSLDVSKNTALERLDCYSNQLSSLDVSGLTALEYLNCDRNQLSSLDVSKNTALEVLSCDDTVTVIGKKNTSVE